MSNQTTKPLHFLGYIQEGIVHPSDRECGRHWNPAILVKLGDELVATTTPKVIEGYETPMSLFSRAYNGKISEYTRKILATN